MKKFILGFFGLSLLSTTGIKAQSFSVKQSVVPYSVYTNGNVHNEITNITSSPIALNWRVLGHDFPEDWKIGTSICDNITCYMNTVVLGTGISPGNTMISDRFSKTMDFKLQILNFDEVSTGTHSLYVEFKDPVSGYADTVEFDISHYGLNVPKVPKSDNITIYPNPAQNDINVLFDAHAGIKNIAVYNLIGKAVSVYRVSGNSAKLDIENIPPGIYFLRFVDGNSRVVATRKFTRQ